MKTVNSLSGGKTSSYLAVHYPADIDIFAIVCVDDPKCGHPDPKVMQYVNDKLEKSGALHWHGEFVGTAESIVTLTTMMQLEQKIGREITWVRGISFDKLIEKRSHIPNTYKPFCSQFLKVVPIYWYLYLNDSLPCSMRIGYRASEPERAEKFTDWIKISKHAEYRPNSDTWINRWEEVESWRVGDFVLIRDNIFHHHIQNFWAENTDVPFPPDTNCQQCFWKPAQQLRKNFDDSPNQMNWAKGKEVQSGNTWKDNDSLAVIEKMGLQLDFNFGVGAGCKAGWCTN